jgi:Flp pilus assembly pilin Flp
MRPAVGRDEGAAAVEVGLLVLFVAFVGITVTTVVTPVVRALLGSVNVP